jgi:hypothetical protein
MTSCRSVPTSARTVSLSSLSVRLFRFFFIALSFALSVVNRRR